MTTRIKICGLAREADVRVADAAGADFLGFVLAPSTRRITPAHARAISDGTRALRVAVTVDATEAELDAIMTEFAPDYIQFHGRESVEAVASAAAHYNVKTIKACPIATRADLVAAERHASADILLYDAKAPPGAAQQGGHGIPIDWTLIANAPRPKVFALAGGLTPDNVADAVRLTRAPVVDTSSGVETAPGVKDSDLIARFIQAARQS